MAETNINFGKIVSTPTPTAWSQAYNAGKVFASISLESEEAPEEQDHLSSLGKELISTFESEFFTLEKKTLETIKQALSTTISKLPQDIKVSMALCYLEENVLYLFAVGGGKAVLKRGEKVGTVLEGEDGSNIKPASGYVQEDDVIVLETKPFLRIISPSTLAGALEGENPEGVAENLAPHVHERPEGGAASVIIQYKKNQVEPVVLPEEEKTEINEQPTEESLNSDDEGVIPVEDIDDDLENEELSQSVKDEATLEEQKELEDETLEEKIEEEAPVKTEETEVSPSPFVTEDRFASSRQNRFNFVGEVLQRIPKDRRRMAIIAGGLIVIIIVVAVLAINKNGSTQNAEEFNKVLTDAKSKYDEGENLKDLNASLAQDSFKQAKDILTKNESKFKDNSSENKQIQDLLAKVNSELKNQGGEKASAKEVDKSVSQILSAEIDNSGGLFFSENTNNVVFLDKSGISQIDKGNGKESQIIKKDWQSPGGVGTFGSNIYVLDKSAGILKFVPSEDTYSKTDYFSDNTPDFSDSVSMAIDGSIYILFKDGSIKKYTRANEDTFDLVGLSKPLSSSAKLFTNDNLDNLYALDPANSRLVVLSKDGTFKTSYSSDVIKNAKDFDVKESDKKTYILSGGKVYQIDL